MGALDAILGYVSQERTNKKNQELAQGQNEWNLKMWMLDNEYNDPSNKMLRDKAAGLNPYDLDMANGSSYSGHSTSGPPVGAPLIPNADPMQAAGNFSSAISTARNLMQEALFKRDTYKLRVAQVAEEVANLKKAGVSMDLANQYQQVVNRYADAMQVVSLGEKKANIDFSKKQCERIDKDIEEAQFRLEKVLPQQILIGEGQIKLNAANFQAVTQAYQNAIKEAELIEAQTVSEEKRAENIEADTANKAASTGLLKQQEKTERARTEAEKLTVSQLRQSYNLFCATFQDQVAIIANQRQITEEQALHYWANFFMRSMGSTLGNEIVHFGEFINAK